MLIDCNSNGVHDDCDIQSGTSLDCDGSGVPDECELPIPDCNGNGLHDACDISGGTSVDCDENGVPDECEAVLFVDASSGGGGDNSENSYHVVTTGAGSPAAVLEGFAITAGNADGLYEDGNGAGLYIGYDAEIGNCTFTRNEAASGGAIFFQAADPSIQDCAFHGNVAYDGGAIYMDDTDANRLVNCRFSGNTATHNGGGLYLTYAAPDVTNCTFSGNAAANNGGGVYSTDYEPAFNNCILWANTDAGGMDESAQVHADDGAYVYYSCVQGGWSGGGGTGNLDTDPLLVRAPDDGGDGWGVGDNDDFGDLRLSPGSPCIDAGNNVVVPAGVSSDFGGKPRFIDETNTADTGFGTPPIVDMGPYESGPGLLKVAPQLGADDPRSPSGFDAFVSPKSKHVGFDLAVVQLTDDVALVSSCTASTGGAPPSVVSLTQLSEPGWHQVQLSAATELAEWTSVTLTVVDTAGFQGSVCFQLSHLPDDLNQDGQVSSSDSDMFGLLFPGGPLELMDLNDDGQVNLNDATKFGQIWSGTSGEGYRPDGTGAWLGQGLSSQPACACGP